MAKKKPEGFTVTGETLPQPLDQEHMTLEVWPLERLVPHPDNPRTVRTDSESFQDLLASVKANGVLEPLTTRDYVDSDKGLGEARKAMGVEFRQVLSGHRRMAAAKLAGYTHVPVRNLGDIDDAVAFDIVAMANLHEDLSPLEEGKRAALWLDRYDQDARAVASKLGKTPHYVVQHAQIYRNLVADWVKATETAREERYGASMRDMLERWTASHWAVIARLPHTIQIQQLKKFQSSSYCSFGRWTVKELEDRIGLEMLSLAKAPFDVATCAKCVNRTGAQPTFLWSDEEQGATGDKEKCLDKKCLDKKCWDRKCIKAEKARFKELIAEKSVPDALPLSTLTKPKDYWKSDAYRKQISALKKAHGKGLLTADAVEICKKGDKGAVPAIVVAGKGKNAVKWVRPLAEKKKPAANSNADWERQRKERQEEARRWKMVEDEIIEVIRSIKVPDLAATAVLAYAVLPGIWGDDIKKLFEETAAKFDVTRGEYVRDRLWQDFLEGLRWDLNLEPDLFQPLCDLLGIQIDCRKMYDEIVADETGGEPPKDAKAKKRKKKAAKKPKKGKAFVCRVCGCTDDDCSQCIEKTGEPCCWVQPDLCSACATPEQIAEADPCGLESCPE